MIVSIVLSYLNTSGIARANGVCLSGHPYWYNNPANLFVVHDTICSGSDYIFPDGTVFSDITSKMSYISTFNSAVNGFDSVVLLDFCKKS